MNAPQRITLKAFLIALAHQEQPLSAELQTQLKEISQDIPSNLGKLNYLGNTYLKELYPQVRASLQKPTAERNKGLPAEIDEIAERRNKEIGNQLDDASDIINRMDDGTLTQTGKAIFSNPHNPENFLPIIVVFGDSVLAGDLIYPTLDLFLYDLREGLGQSSAIIDGNRKDLWGKISPQIDDNMLEKLAKAEKPEADYVRLLGSQKFEEFEPPYDRHFFTVQLGDTYALQADCSGKYAEPDKKDPNLAKQPVDETVATLKQIIVSRINRTQEEKELQAGKRGTLGQTWLFWAQLASENQDVEKTAKTCYTQLVGESWEKDFQGEADFMGARVFELWRFPPDWNAGWEEFSPENQHVLIFLFRAGEYLGKIRGNMAKISFDCMRLFCYRHKVIWAYWQSRRLRADLKKKYSAAR
jgi:hypothetical protein